MSNSCRVCSLILVKLDLKVGIKRYGNDLMSDEQGPALSRERKRPGPTIDLRANAPSGDKSPEEQKAGVSARPDINIASRPRRMYQHVSEYLRMTTSRLVPERSHRFLFGAAAVGLVLAVVFVMDAWAV